MANQRANNNAKKKNGIVKLKIVVEKLVQKSLLLSKKSAAAAAEDVEEVNVPEDVKEGHFAVIAVDEDELKRFVVPLSYLNHPSFLRLLEQAAEEYGFDHEGALTIPCRPCELEKILAQQFRKDRDLHLLHYWGSSSKKPLVKSF